MYKIYTDIYFIHHNTVLYVNNEIIIKMKCKFIPQDDIGLGTVVGSAVFNIMFVISICALCGGMVSIKQLGHTYKRAAQLSSIMELRGNHVYY